MADGRTNDYLDEAIERNEAQMLAHVGRTQGLEAAHKLARKRSHDRVLAAMAGTAVLVVVFVWLTGLAPWIKWLVTGLAALPLAFTPILAKKNSQDLDEIREQQLREHLAAKKGEDGPEV